MTFSQKVKCVIELTFYTLALVVFAAIIDQVIILAISQLLNILPGEILYHVVETIQGILQLVYMVIIIYLVVKLYKVRYLDYYQVPEVEVVYEEQKEVTKEKVKINEEKIALVKQSLDKLDESFEEIKLNKISIPMVVYGMYRMIKDNKDIEKYITWLRDDFIANYDQNENFKAYCQSSTSSSENVKGRLEYFRNVIREM